MNEPEVYRMAIPTREGWKLIVDYMAKNYYMIGKIQEMKSKFTPGDFKYKVYRVEHDPEEPTTVPGEDVIVPYAGDYDSIEEAGMYYIWLIERDEEESNAGNIPPEFPVPEEGVHYEWVELPSSPPKPTKEEKSELMAAKVALGIFYDPPEIPLNDPLHPATEPIAEILSAGGFVMGSEEPQKQGHPIIDGMVEMMESEEPPPDFLDQPGPDSPERSRDLLSISSRYVAGMHARTLAGTIMDRERLELIRAWRGITFSYYVDRVLRDAGKTGIETSRVQLSGPWETEDQAIGWIVREQFSTEEITLAIQDLNDFLNYPEDKFFDRGEWEDEISMIRDLLRRILADVKEREG